MRIFILRALLLKEFRRHVANRGGIVLAALLIVAALMLSIFNPAGVEAAGSGMELVGGVHHCFIDYTTETPLIKELKNDIPPALVSSLTFREWKSNRVTTVVNNPPGTGTIRIREVDDNGTPRLSIEVWHPPGEPGAMAAYEQWLWKRLHGIFRDRVRTQLSAEGQTHEDLPEVGPDDLWAIRDAFRTLGHEAARRSREPQTTLQMIPQLEIKRDGLGSKPLDFRSAIATALVVFALYFTCCYLLPTMNCEERERGVLLAQALSPASPWEIVVAKFLFYPTAGLILAAILAGIYSPTVVNSLFFWLALLALGAGFLGIGMTISTLARTQRSAFMGAMCYLLSVSLLLFICSQNQIPYLSYLAIEFHGPKILHAAITKNVMTKDWYHLIAALSLGAMWMSLAAWLFRRRGWQ
jgi:hypothetical protein